MFTRLFSVSICLSLSLSVSLYLSLSHTHTHSLILSHSLTYLAVHSNFSNQKNNLTIIILDHYRVYFHALLFIPWAYRYHSISIISIYYHSIGLLGYNIICFERTSARKSSFLVQLLVQSYFYSQSCLQ